MTSAEGSFGRAIRPRFPLEGDMAFVNHGSFGATPREVLAAQRRWQDALEAQPLAFMRALPVRLRQAAGRVASHLGATPSDLVFVDNASTGVNAVLRSLPLGPDDVVLTTDHGYGAVRNTLDHLCARSGARLIVARVPFPIDDPQQVVEAIRDALSDGVTVAVFDHITSITGLVFPVEELVRLCHARAVRVLVDGAHVPGQLQLQLREVGADWYVGNLHKWLFSPKGCAVLHAPGASQDGLHPTVISHGYGDGFVAEFDWVGTRDPSPWLSSGAALDFVQALGPELVIAYDHELRRQAHQMLVDRFALAAPAPESMLAAMSTLPVPFATDGTQRAADAINLALWTRHRVEAQFMAFGGQVWFRVAAQIYNTPADFERLGDALQELV